MVWWVHHGVVLIFWFTLHGLKACLREECQPGALSTPVQAIWTPPPWLVCMAESSLITWCMLLGTNLITMIFMGINDGFSLILVSGLLWTVVWKREWHIFNRLAPNIKLLSCRDPKIQSMVYLPFATFFWNIYSVCISSSSLPWNILCTLGLEPFLVAIVRRSVK